MSALHHDALFPVSFLPVLLGKVDGWMGGLKLLTLPGIVCGHFSLGFAPLHCLTADLQEYKKTALRFLNMGNEYAGHVSISSPESCG